MSQPSSLATPSSRTSKVMSKCRGLRPIGSRRKPAERNAPTVIRVSCPNRTSGVCWASSSRVRSRNANTEIPKVP
jgi:hypothetical protein